MTAALTGCPVSNGRRAKSHIVIPDHPFVTDFPLMSFEIERKFLVVDTAFLRGARGVSIQQAYLSRAQRSTLRVRIAGHEAWITVKGRTSGITRREFEYPIPLADAERMMAELAESPLIVKTRYAIRYASHIWDVDVFEGDNKGLVIAEVELQGENESFERPPWLGEEVTADFRYSNSSLCFRPWCSWHYEYPSELPGIEVAPLRH
jgi:adenylate cyclase